MNEAFMTPKVRSS